MKRTVLLLAIIMACLLLHSEYISKIRMVNSTFTNRDFLVQQLTFSEGEYAGGADISESVLNLKKMDLFGLVRIEAVKTDSLQKTFIVPDSMNSGNINDTVDIYITAKEMIPVLPSLGLELENTEKWKIALGISFANMLRKRHIIEGSFTFGYVTEFAVKYQIPPVYSRPYNFQFTGNYANINKPYVGLWENHRQAVIGGGYTMHPKVKPEFSIGFDRVTLDIDSFQLSSINSAAVDYDEFLILRYQMETDFRDDPYYPQNGMYAEVEYIYNINTWNLNIDRWKLSADIRLFKNAGDIVFGMRNMLLLQNGTIARYNMQETEYLENRAIPNNELSAYNRYSGNFELRYSIPPLYFTMELPVLGAFSIGTMVVGFADWSYTGRGIAGLPSSDMSDFCINDLGSYRWGYGGGLRLYSEIFNLLGIDVGFDPQQPIASGYKINLCFFSWNF